MKRSTLSLILALLLCGCPSSDMTADDAPTQRRAKEKKTQKLGEIHMRGERRSVTPFLLHDPKLDLAVQCRLLQDKLKAEGEEVPLCFAEVPSKVTPNTLRIEHFEGLKIGEALSSLRTKNEGAHFMAMRGGAIYQTLDVAHAARRGDTYREGEIRVLSGEEASHQKLIDTIREVFPKIAVTEVEAPAPKRTPKAKVEPPKPNDEATSTAAPAAPVAPKKRSKPKTPHHHHPKHP